MFPTNCARYGLGAALRVLRFETSKAWLDHVAEDDFLPYETFRTTYGANLPGAEFTRFGYFAGVVWRSPLRP